MLFFNLFYEQNFNIFELNKYKIIQFYTLILFYYKH